jgi:uncharacterized membrane protein YcaP (DUF421 family)
MDLFIIFLRTIMIYFVVFLVMRIMGKREIGKLSIFDLVISIMIAEIAVFVVEDIKKPILEGLIPMATLVVIQILIAYITLKSRKLRLWFDGTPSILIENGQINREEMKKQKYNLDDLLLQLRQSKVKNVADVEFAILETTGKLTVLRKNEDNPEPEQMDSDRLREKGNTKIRFEGLPLLLIMDGKVQDDNLAKIGKNRFWLKNKIQEQGASDFKSVFFCSIDHRGKIFLDKKT